MFHLLPETERAAATVGAFVGTFFVALSIGRLLKRRAGVGFGTLYQLFCLTLAFYAALATWGVHSSWRNHVGALLVLLSTVVIVALVNRYVWDIYFEKRRRVAIPQLLRETVALIVFLIALVVVLSVGYHAEAELKGLLAGSGIAAIIIGFAAQSVLGNIAAGIALQINRPYRVGDWLRVADNYGEVMEINWRSTRVRTNDLIYLDIPNAEIARQTIINLHYPTSLHAMRLRVGVDYNSPPNAVKDALLRAVDDAAGVVKSPAPKIYLMDFGDHAVIYEIKFYIEDHAAFNEITDGIRTNVWYELKRERITIPFPIRTLQIDRRKPETDSDQRGEARKILQRDPLFQCLSDSQLTTLLGQSELDHYGRGERIIEEAANGDSMFVLLRGNAQVTVDKQGTQIRVGVLRAGDCFGEMSLLTGEKRTATVRADGDCYVLEIGKPVMGEVIRESPACLQQLSELLARRRMENEGIISKASLAGRGDDTEREYSAGFLHKLHAFFEL